MMIAADQHSPWFTPRSTFAATTQLQLGAKMISSGTGSAAIHPAMSIRRRPQRSAAPPANAFANAFTIPNVSRNERMLAREAMPNSCSARSGRMERSIPTMAPTNALITSSSENCPRFSRRPRRLAGAATAAALGALTARPGSGDGAAIGAGFEIGEIDSGQLARLVARHDRAAVRGRRRQAIEDLLGERSGILGQANHLANDTQRGRDRPAIERDRTACVSREDEEVRVEPEQPVERAVQQQRSLPGLLRARFEV